MRRPLLALALLAGAVGVGAGSASTASNTLQTTNVAVHRVTSISGATPVSLGHTVTDGMITAVTPKVRDVGLLSQTATARFAGGTTVTCTRLSLQILDLLTDLGEATYTCTGLLAPAERPPNLYISVD